MSDLCPEAPESFYRVLRPIGIGLLALSTLLACSSSDDSPPDSPPVQTVDERDPSVARQWNEITLTAIRNDFARPTVHARNLFHVSAAMYDAWAAYSSSAQTYLYGKQLHGFDCPAVSVPPSADPHLSREQAVSFAAYRLLEHRFDRSPGSAATGRAALGLMAALGYDTANTATEAATGGPAALGNYIADCYIRYGLQDGSNEQNGYANTSYAPVNGVIKPNEPGNPDITDLNRWQPISLPLFIDQAGNPINSAPTFLSPEWGSVLPFALTPEQRTVYQREGFDYAVFHDPGPPPLLNSPSADEYRWNFELVSIWASHLDPSDGVMVDISPANIQKYPTSMAEYPQFYDLLDGGDSSVGYAINPVTGASYEPQMVPRGDYARVLAEFWADGPDSETPPGHWFVILNSITDHPALARRIGGAGPYLGPLEWDVKAYFALGGAMHDAAITAWGIKGWYDYVRPLSAIRAMADLGQSTDPADLSYDPNGVSLVPGYIELIRSGDELAGSAGEHVGKIKLYTWRGPDYIDDPEADHAGVGWIRAENWWPYQRPSFVTPPFAGYVSGHSTYSQAAATVLTALTGSNYFPGGMSGFEVKANEFLVFEQGPSVDMTLQWATYQDAADQCSLSRIWGGIHPPADDIPGRIIGREVGADSWRVARNYFGY